MSEVVRLTFVSHAMTDAMAAGRFPTDEPVNDLGRRQIQAVDVEAGDHAVCGPESRTQQTAELLGLTPAIEAGLADLDCGRWRGDFLARVPPTDMTIWLNIKENQQVRNYLLGKGKRLDPGVHDANGDGTIDVSDVTFLISQHR